MSCIEYFSLLILRFGKNEKLFRTHTLYTRLKCDTVCFVRCGFRENVTPIHVSILLCTSAFNTFTAHIFACMSHEYRRPVSFLGQRPIMFLFF